MVSILEQAEHCSKVRRSEGKNRFFGNLLATWTCQLSTGIRVKTVSVVVLVTTRHPGRRLQSTHHTTLPSGSACRRLTAALAIRIVQFSRKRTVNWASSDLTPSARPGPAQTCAAQVRARPRLHVPARPLGAADRASALQRNPVGQQPDRKCHPALGPREEELAVHRSSRRRPEVGHHLVHRRLLPAPRQGPLRVPARRAHPPAGHDQPRRSVRAVSGPLAACVVSVAPGAS